jgi:hypothetical protein
MYLSPTFSTVHALTFVPYMYIGATFLSRNVSDGNRYPDGNSSCYFTLLLKFVIPDCGFGLV